MLPPYNVLAQRLDIAETDKEFVLPGNYLEFASNGSMAGIRVRIGSKTADAIPLDMFKELQVPAGFLSFYVSWTSQPGRTLFIFTGREGTKAKRV